MIYNHVPKKAVWTNKYSDKPPTAYSNGIVRNLDHLKLRPKTKRDATSKNKLSGMIIGLFRAYS
jgi:hypothetical protein